MSVNCPITVAFEVSKINTLKELGRKHLEIMKDRSDTQEHYDADAHRFLEYVAEGKGVGIGPKGDMFTWGNVGNYGSIEHFVDALRPFWQDLYAEHALMFGDGVVVTFQQEQRPFMKIVEVSKDQTMPRDRTGLVMRAVETSFPLYGWYFERPEGMLPPGTHTEEWDGS